MSTKLIRLPEVMHRLGLIPAPTREEVRKKDSTFYRRYRTNPSFPRPVATPDGLLAWRESEIDSYLEGLGHLEGTPRAGYGA